MRRTLLAVLIVLIGALSVRAQTLTAEQKSKLMELLPPPQMSYQFNFGVRRGEFWISSEELDRAGRVGRLLLKKVPKEPRDEAAHHLALARALSDSGDSAKAAIQAANAEKILDALLVGKDLADRVELELQRAESQEFQEKYSQARQSYEAAVKRYDTSWKAWLKWYLFLEGEASRIAVEGTQEKDLNKIVERVRGHKLSEADNKAIQARFTEAEAALKRARELSPREPQIRIEYLSGLANHVGTENILSLRDGKVVDISRLSLNLLLDKRYLNALEETITLLPDAPLPLLLFTFYRVTAQLVDNPNVANSRSILNALPEPEKVRLRAAIKRLTEIGGNTRLTTEERSRAWEGAGILSLGFVRGDEGNKAAEHYYRESRLVAPERVGGWMGSIVTMAEVERYEEGFHLAEEYRKRFLRPDARLVYASLATRTGRLREAEAEYRALRDEQPDLLPAYVGVATVLAKRTTTEPDRLAEAVTELNRIKEKFDTNFGEHGVSVYTVTGVLYALAGQVGNGIQCLEAVQKAEPDSVSVPKMLEILRAAR